MTKIHRTWKRAQRFTIFPGDCADLIRSLPDESVDLVMTSPPYCIGKAYEDKTQAEDFVKNHNAILPEILRVTRVGGSICWQVGSHVHDNIVVPLDAIVYSSFSKSDQLQLRNRIVWTFGHGTHCTRRFSGRHETILWFTKGDDYHFELDAVRVPQKYPGKKHYKGRNRGKPSGNPLGKNPGDVWDIPNVKANHVEKTKHPCQFPVALAQRLIRALCPPNGLVVDPYIGSGSTGIAALVEGREFLGCDIEAKYVKIARERIRIFKDGYLKLRPLNQPVHVPSSRDSVARIPAQWL